MPFYPPTSIEWKEPAAIPPGTKMVVLEGDPAKEGPFVARFQFPDGYHIPPHTHPKTERVTVLSGNFYLATGETLDRNSGTKLPAGSFGYRPAGMKHAAWSEGETVIQLHWNWAVANQIRQSGRRPEEREEITLDGVSRNA